MLEAILGPLKAAEASSETKVSITKPWVQSLAHNKKKWKEQAAKGWVIQQLCVGHSTV